MARTTWNCTNCGHQHRSNREQCVHCGYVDLEPTQGNIGINRTLAAALPMLLIGLLMLLMAVVLFL